MMTMLAGPGAALKAGSQRLWKPTSMRVSELILAIVVGAVIVPLAALLNAASRSVSRRRELNADYGAALLTGSPAALASALERVSQTLGRTKLPDLRAVCARDAFHILPTGPEPTGGVDWEPPIRRSRSAWSNFTRWSAGCSTRDCAPKPARRARPPSA